MKRAVSIFAVSIGSAYIGFLLAGFIASLVLRSNDIGLAPTATVAVIAIAGASIGLVAAAIIASRTNDARLFPWAFRVPVLALLLYVAVDALSGKRPALPTTATNSVVPSDSAEKPPPPLPGAIDSLIGLVMMSADSLGRFETREIDYEVPAVTVYRQQGNWYLLGTKSGGRDWIDAKQVGAFSPLSQLMPEKLNYLTETWDRRIRESADPASPPRTITITGENEPEVPARVIEASGSGPLLAFKVEVFDKSPCSGEEPKVIATGWIPAWNSQGKLNAWFFSRGC